MSNFLGFFQKVNCDTIILKEYFDNFMAMYGIIIPMDSIISNLNVSKDDGGIIYNLDLKKPLSEDVLYDINSSTVNLYGHHYSLTCVVTDLKLSIRLLDN